VVRSLGSGQQVVVLLRGEIDFRDAVDFARAAALSTRLEHYSHIIGIR